MNDPHVEAMAIVIRDSLTRPMTVQELGEICIDFGSATCRRNGLCGSRSLSSN